MLILGLAVFFAAHLVPSVPALRDLLIQRLGKKAYRGAFSIVALVGLVLVVLGKGAAPFEAVYAPPSWGRHVTMLAVLLAMILLPAAHMPTNIKRFTAHPMNWAVVLWAGGHLLANGDRASLLLFGSFGLYALFDIWSANRRGAAPSGEKLPASRDLRVIAAGLVAYAVLLFLHPYLFGVPVLMR
jgi:uncharacterized membrane protein